MAKKKRLYRAISAVTAAVMIGTFPAVCAALAGDANGDGVLGSQDIKTLGNYIVRRTDKISADADMNSDGTINVFDMISLRRAVLKAEVSDGNYIHLKGNTIVTEGSNMTLTGNNVVTITASGSYYVDGTLDDGQIIVNVPDEKTDAETVKIFLDGANITGKSAPAILIENAENTSINLVEGTVSSLSDGDTAYEGDNVEAAVLHAKDDMTIKGGGTLNITANTQNAVHCNNDLKVNGPVLNVKTEKGDALRGKKSVTVKDGTVNIDSKGDGIKSTKGNVEISGGTITIKADNDAVQSETNMTVSDGTLYAYGKRSFTAGEGCTVDITGGTVVATSNEEFINTSGITVNTIVLNYTEKLEAKPEISIKKSGADVYSVKPDKKYTYAMICNPALVDGTYNVYTGGVQMTHKDSAAGEFTKKGAVSVFNAVAELASSAPSVTIPSDGENNVVLSASGISFSGAGAAVSSDKKTLTISQPGTYSVTGEMEGGQIVVDVDKTTYPDATVELSLEGMSLTNTLTSPVYVASVSDKCAVSAKNGTVNTISDGSSEYTNADGDNGAVYSKDDLTFKGKGTLIVNGNYQDAIVGKDDIKINNGTLKVTAADDGIRGKDSVTIGDAKDTDFSTLNVTVEAKAGDAVKSTNADTDSSKSLGIVTINGGTIDLNAYADGIQAEQEFVMNGGDLTIKTYEGSGYTGSGTTTGGNTDPWGGGRPGGPGGGFGGMQDGNSNKTDISAKGIKSIGIYDTAGTTWQSAGNITINGGTITIDSSDDAVHCGGAMTINGGTFKIATADDAFHSDHDLILGTKDGKNDDFNIYVTKCYEGIEGENIYQYSGTVVVKADDDGYNAAGGADSSGNANPGGWNPGGGFGSAGNNALSISGGVAIVQSQSGDHDAFDSNGSLTVTGGCVIANGNEPLDSDGTNSASGGTVMAVSQGSTIPVNTQFTVADSTGKVLISFKTMQAMGSVTTKHSDGTVSLYTGGTISGGTDLIKSDDSQTVYTSGTITGGTAVSASSGGGGQTGPWGW